MASPNNKTKHAVNASLPARVADQELAHLENMVRYVRRAPSGDEVRGMNVEYWMNRINALFEESDLVPAQKNRARRLLRELELPVAKAQGPGRIAA
jgi:hypothetical protein